MKKLIIIFIVFILILFFKLGKFIFAENDNSLQQNPISYIISITGEYNDLNGPNFDGRHGLYDPNKLFFLQNPCRDMVLALVLGFKSGYFGGQIKYTRSVLTKESYFSEELAAEHLSVSTWF